jgi:hypothetical protein
VLYFAPTCKGFQARELAEMPNTCIK